ncbi:MAG: vegetative protein [Candidatus Binataceae bacterium]
MANTENCKAAECARGAFAKGYCRKHYRLWTHGEMPKPRYKICTFEKCRKHRFRGSLCEEHYAAKTGKSAATPEPAASAAPAA